MVWLQLATFVASASSLSNKGKKVFKENLLKMFVCLWERERERDREQDRGRTSDLLENLLQDFHLLLLQLCHHVHTISQTLWEGPYTHRHITCGYISCVFLFVSVCSGVCMCVNLAYRSFLWWPWGLEAAVPCSSGPSASETSGSHL